MKASLIISILIFFNTSALVTKPIFNFLESVNLWWFVAIEVLLLLSFFINRFLKSLNMMSEIDLSNIKLYVRDGSEGE